MKYNSGINMHLNKIKSSVKCTLIYLKGKNSKLNKEEIIMQLSYIDKIIAQLKEEIINYIYFLEDKVDIVYEKEIKKSVINFIDSLREDDN